MNLKLKNEVYNVLKWITILVLPAAEVLWITLGNLWNWPNVEPVAGTIAAITTFLGAILGISCYNYNKEEK